MTTDSDSTLDGGRAEQPNSVSSSNSEVQPSSTQAPSLEQIAQKLERLERMAQSDKDRAVTKTNKRLDELQENLTRVEELLTHGLSLAQAVETAQYEKDIEEIRNAYKSGSLPASRGNGTGKSEEVLKVITQYGLDPNSAEGIELLQTGDPDKAELAILRKRKASIGAAQTLVGEPPKPADNESLKREYIKQLQANRGNRNAIKAIQDEFRQKGFDPGSVGFSV